MQDWSPYLGRYIAGQQKDEWCCTYFILISLLVFEHDKLTILGCFGHFALYFLLKV